MAKDEKKAGKMGKAGGKVPKKGEISAEKAEMMKGAASLKAADKKNKLGNKGKK